METIYLHILLEHIWLACILPFANDATIYAMMGFGGYNIPQAVAMALIGCFIGFSINWLIGQFIYKLYSQGKLKMSQKGFEKYQRFYQRYFLFSLLLSWLPFMNITVILAGAYNVRYHTAITLAMLGELGYFLFLLQQ